MARHPDWDALGALFNKPPPESATAPPSACEGSDKPFSEPSNAVAQHPDMVRYLGETMPKWLARDLIHERAAIYEYEAGMTRETSEAEAIKYLEK